MNRERNLQSGIFLIGTIIISLGMTLFLIEGVKLEEYIVIKLMYFVVSIYLMTISYIAYKKEKLYWIIEKDIIENISEEKKEEVGKIYFKKFKICCIALLIYSIIGFFIRMDLFLDIVVYMILIIVLGKRAVILQE